MISFECTFQGLSQQLQSSCSEEQLFAKQLFCRKHRDGYFFALEFNFTVAAIGEFLILF